MTKGEELLLARNRARPRVWQSEIEILLDLTRGVISGYETGKIDVSERDFGRIMGAIEEISTRKKETQECDQATLAST